uniref:U11/U12 small nuclear ribonucleoprotein 35 kDa protein n=1 Tax=Leptobrachium leishanense TaxID=445787 RepID=A0A8C5LWF1_9ANUR
MNEWNPIAKKYDPLKAGSIDGTDEEPHDRAVLRAMLARYVPNKGVVGDPHMMLFVSRLSQTTTEEKVKEVFSRYGDIQSLRLVRDFVTGFSKGYAFIEYKQESALMKAHRDANKLVIDKQEVFVDFELERTLKGWIPRRLGGGFGGKKESGQLRFGGRDRPFRKPINLPFLNMTEGRGEKRARSRSRERMQEWRAKNTERDRDTRVRDVRWQDKDRAPSRSEKDRYSERNLKEERSRDRERHEKDKQRKDGRRDGSRERDFKKRRE